MGEYDSTLVHFLGAASERGCLVVGSFELYQIKKMVISVGMKWECDHEL